MGAGVRILISKTFCGEKFLSQIANDIVFASIFQSLQDDIKILNTAVEIRKFWFLRFSNIIFFSNRSGA